MQGNIVQLAVSPFAPSVYPDMPPVPGVVFSTFASGMRYKGRDDMLLAMLEDDEGCVAGAFTRSYAASPCVESCRAALDSGVPPRALIVTAGISNACTGDVGRATCKNIAGYIGKRFGVDARSVYYAATGVIGDFLTDSLIESALPHLGKALSPHYGWKKAAEAIMTTDTYPKVAVRKLVFDGVETVFCGIAKGSGMIAPNMATMLAFCFSDVNVEDALWRTLHADAVVRGYNAITVDGDTSTSDTALSFTSRRANHSRISSESDPRYALLRDTIEDIHRDLAMRIVEDGEGITKRIEILVEGTDTDDDARTLAMSVGNSPLVKTAAFGCDPNWGRVMMALGKAGVPFNADDVTLAFGPFTPVKNGVPCSVDLKAMAAYLKDNRFIEIRAKVGEGSGAYTAWTCDLSYDYIKINADYRS
ncbi:MAG: bifunctional glutamate N-acetyltransferase/amino-acid acetyltransferase ArgJ [Rickettsiales bacterium]